MILVFYIALGLLILLIITSILFFMIYISKLQLHIKNLNMSNTNKRKNNEKICVQISLKIGKWNWLKVKLDKNKVANIYIKIKKKKPKINIDKDVEEILSNGDIRKMILNTKFELERFNLKLAIGTEDYIFTSYTVAIVSMIISNIIPHIINEKNYEKNEKNLSKIIHYRIVPIYKEENLYNIHLDIDLSTRIIHLIYIIFKYRKWKKCTYYNK